MALMVVRDPKAEQAVLDGYNILILAIAVCIVGGLGSLVLGAIIMSIGFHWFYPSSSSVVLMGVGAFAAPAEARTRALVGFNPSAPSSRNTRGRI